jgi:hypothetical protein
MICVDSSNAQVPHSCAISHLRIEVPPDAANRAGSVIE